VRWACFSFARRVGSLSTRSGIPFAFASPPLPILVPSTLRPHLLRVLLSACTSWICTRTMFLRWRLPPSGARRKLCRPRLPLFMLVPFARLTLFLASSRELSHSFRPCVARVHSSLLSDYGFAPFSSAYNACCAYCVAAKFVLFHSLLTSAFHFLRRFCNFFSLVSVGPFSFFCWLGFVRGVFASRSLSCLYCFGAVSRSCLCLLIVSAGVYAQRTYLKACMQTAQRQISPTVGTRQRARFTPGRLRLPFKRVDVGSLQLCSSSQLPTVLVGLPPAPRAVKCLHYTIKFVAHCCVAWFVCGSGLVGSLTRTAGFGFFCKLWEAILNLGLSFIVVPASDAVELES